ncbi:hypothetical protein PR048_029249 [Dryococelus australis]|uniref:Uncharacterized protein n=1 Tax=Dryococelus australis TaxID=614101 RepID=A0ABQ9GCU9_9NEOP|nr:hypothetical protein PR048_029249 [Dryococelus australis]
MKKIYETDAQTLKIRHEHSIAKRQYFPSEVGPGLTTTSSKIQSPMGHTGSTTLIIPEPFLYGFCGFVLLPRGIIAQSRVVPELFNSKPSSLPEAIAFNHDILDTPALAVLQSRKKKKNTKNRTAFITNAAIQRHDGNTARLARRSDEAVGARVTVARIAPSLLDLGAARPPINAGCQEPRGACTFPRFYTSDVQNSFNQTATLTLLETPTDLNAMHVAYPSSLAGAGPISFVSPGRRDLAVMKFTQEFDKADGAWLCMQEKCCSVHTCQPASATINQPVRTFAHRETILGLEKRERLVPLAEGGILGCMCALAVNSDSDNATSNLGCTFQGHEAKNLGRMDSDVTSAARDGCANYRPARISTGPAVNLPAFHPAGSLPDFRMWESCRRMPLVSPVSPFFHPGTASYSPRSPSLALKTSLLRAAQISSHTHSVRLQ